MDSEDGEKELGSTNWGAGRRSIRVEGVTLAVTLLFIWKEDNHLFTQVSNKTKHKIMMNIDKDTEHWFFHYVHIVHFLFFVPIEGYWDKS